MNDPIFSSLTGKEPVSRIITSSLANAQTIAGSTGIITNHTKQSNASCSCGVGNIIYYIVSWY